MVSGSEVAYFSLRTKQMEDLEDDETPNSERVLRLWKDPQHLLATILIANNLFNIGIIITSFFLTKRLFFNWGPSWLAGLFNAVVVTLILVLFGEIVPKVYANQYNVSLAKLTSAPLSFLKKLLYPISFLLVGSTSLIEQRLQKMRQSEVLDIKDIQDAIDIVAENITSQTNSKEDEEELKEEIEMIKGIVSLKKKTVRQIMTNRTNMVCVEKNTSYKDLQKVITQNNFSRIPIYDESIDNITGVLHAKDLLPYLNKKDDFKWQKEIKHKEAFFVPESKKIDQLLREMQLKRQHMAIVIDEYGGTEGLVTLEDILEEVVGEIEDEFDKAEDSLNNSFKKINDNHYEFDGQVMLTDCCKLLNIDEDTFDEAKGESDSLNGLLMEINGSVPTKSDQVVYKNFIFSVKKLSDKNIIDTITVKIRPIEDVEIPKQAGR